VKQPLNHLARRTILAALLLALVGPVGLTGRAQARDEAVELDTPTGTLYGTLRLAGSERTPVTLLIAGSGPTDRDGNSPALPGKNESLKMLAEALAGRGISSLRYDKRGVAQSATAATAERDLRFTHYVDDAARWIVKLRNDPRFSTITVVGHSEGSLIGAMAAKAARADAFVSIAGPARRASDVLRDQLRPQLAAQPALAEANERILQTLEAGQTVESIPAEPGFAALYRASVQPYLISWFRLVPSEQIATLTIPVLIVQGTTDIQVPVSEAKALAAAVPSAELRTVEGMNHLMKAAPADRLANLKTYSDPTLPIVVDVPNEVANFIRSLKPARHPEGERRSPRGIVIAEIAGGRLSIEHGRPSKRGREIWGALVPFGKVWMPGADEATTFVTSAPLAFESLDVPAGEYTLYLDPGRDDVALIVNRDTNIFHLTYRPGRNLGRVPMTLTRLETPVEQLTFAFEPDADGGRLVLRWDDREYSVRFRPVGGRMSFANAWRPPSPLIRRGPDESARRPPSRR
jgi:pimeloyl-ACP methyl ester carboxylesterase